MVFHRLKISFSAKVMTYSPIDVGNSLNKALEALEEANPEKLSGVLTNINFRIHGAELEI